jgi:membrane associated rhomboid family serine protease
MAMRISVTVPWLRPCLALEIVTHSVGNDVALLKLGALPDNGELNGQYWRFATYSFLHFNWAHLLVFTISRQGHRDARATA